VIIFRTAFYEITGKTVVVWFSLGKMSIFHFSYDFVLHCLYVLYSIQQKLKAQNQMVNFLGGVLKHQIATKCQQSFNSLALVASSDFLSAWNLWSNS